MIVNELPILGTPINDDDLTEKILDGLVDEYKEMVLAIQARYTPVTFDELQEKFLAF